MSGRHRVERPRRVRVTLLIAGRLVWRAVRPCLVAPAAGVRWLVDKVVAWAETRFDDRDPFADVHLDPQNTTPDPVADALPAPVVEPAPLSLSPDRVLPVLHSQHPHLPGTHVHWHIHDSGVTGEVYALDADEAGQFSIVQMYADALGVERGELTEDGRVTVVAAGAFADVTITVVAVLIHDDTMPLPIFEAAAADPTVGDDTLTTREISERELVEAGVR